MAVWNYDNVIVTKKGNEVLSKVQTGIGELKISRIVSGEGYVDEDALYTSENVQGERQQLDVEGITTDSNGSTIRISLSNLNVLDGYYLHQIGVYVTHPDFEGEVLYLIAQCDTSSPDYIPPYSETPMTLKYTVYMEHRGTSNITIIVNPNGYVMYEDIGKPGGVAPLDDSGKVPANNLPTLNFIPYTEKGKPSGIASLDETGKVPLDQLPGSVMSAITQVSYNKGG